MENTTNNNKVNETEKVSLSTLAEGAIPTAAPEMPTKLPKLDPKTVKDVNVSEVVQPKKSNQVQTEMGNPMIDSALQGLDDAIERTRQESLEIVEKGEEERTCSQCSYKSTSILHKYLKGYLHNTLLELK